MKPCLIFLFCVFVREKFGSNHRRCPVRKGVLRNFAFTQIKLKVSKECFLIFKRTHIINDFMFLSSISQIYRIEETWRRSTAWFPSKITVSVNRMIFSAGLLSRLDILLQKFIRYNRYQKNYERSLLERTAWLTLKKSVAFLPVSADFDLNCNNVLNDVEKKQVKLLLEESK